MRVLARVRAQATIPRALASHWANSSCAAGSRNRNLAWFGSCPVGVRQPVNRAAPSVLWATTSIAGVQTNAATVPSIASSSRCTLGRIEEAALGLAVRVRAGPSARTRSPR